MHSSAVAHQAAQAAHSAAGQPYVLTLLLDSHSQSRLNALRKAHFPPHRNHLDAHVTLFHALPPAHLARVRADLAHLCELTPPYDVIVGPVFKMSNSGVGVDVESRKKRTQDLRRRLLKRWTDSDVPLTNQDKHNLTRPHVTIQNKVTPEVALDTFELVNKDWQGWKGNAKGFSLFEYQNTGKWIHQEDFLFTGTPPQPAEPAPEPNAAGRLVPGRK